jgi:phosphatidylglycerol---prolipoprotein diacylglyceryl transferase
MAVIARAFASGRHDGWDMTTAAVFLAIPFPNIDPVAFSIGPVSVKWYGLAYAAGLMLGWIYVKRILLDMRLWPPGGGPFSTLKADDMLLYMTAGVVIGGRLGYVLFYKPEYYLANPFDIPKVWMGGMSFHGGFVGSMVALALFARQNGVNMLTVLDLASCATPIGLLFGRLANFINAELWGRVSNVPWAMVFPDREAGPAPRHPSQLYEAGLEGLALFLICGCLIYKRDALKRPGLIAGVFTAGYGITRSFCELFREPDYSHWATVGPMTAGILYSLPMIAAGVYLAMQARERGARVA